MNKLPVLIVLLVLAGATFVSCKKDDASASNSVTISGSFDVGEKTFNNPTFDLGSPNDHIGYFTPMIGKTENMIVVEPSSQLELGNNIVLDYELDIYRVTPGEVASYARLAVFLPEKNSGLWIYCNNVAVTLTKVGAVGDYIEGKYEGTFLLDKKEEIHFVKGYFKVKHVEQVK